MHDLAPIVLFVYNRPGHTLKTLEALSENDLAQESHLFIYADGPKQQATVEELKKIQEVEKILNQKAWLGKITIVKRNSNYGLADNIIQGVSSVLDEFGKVIVLEDDIVTSKGFLKYMNDALFLYKDENRVMHISGYMFPVNITLPETFFYNQASCWGWATWKRSWDKYNASASELLSAIQRSDNVSHFNINDSYNFFGQLKNNAEGRLKTWAVKWHASVYLSKGLCLHPSKSLVANIGMDNSGVNSHANTAFETLMASYIAVKPITLKENQAARKAVGKFYRSMRPSKNTFVKRIFLKLKKLLKNA